MQQRLKKARQLLQVEDGGESMKSLNYSEIKINLKGSPSIWGVKSWKQMCLLKYKQVINENDPDPQQYSPVLTLVVNNSTTINQLSQFIRKKLEGRKGANEKQKKQFSKEALQLYCIGRLITSNGSMSIKEVIDKYQTNYFTCAKMQTFGYHKSDEQVEQLHEQKHRTIFHRLIGKCIGRPSQTKH